MKKFMPLVLALLMWACLCSCGNKESASAENKKTEQENVVTTEVVTKEDKDSNVAYRFDGTTTGDVTVEEVVVRPHTVGYDGGYFFDWEMKVRNTGNEDTIPDETVLRVWFRYLDENGDVIAETQSEAGKYSPVKSGQAEWIQINTRLGSMDSSEVEATAFIEIFAYTKKVRTKPEVYYEEPILIDIREFVKE